MAKKHLLSYREVLEMIDFYYDCGIKYEFDRCGNSIRLYKNGIVYYACTLETGGNKRSDVTLPISQVAFINKVKRYIENNNIHKRVKPNYKSTKKIKFFDYNKDIELGEIFDNPHSVDISKAYWYGAYKDRFINDDLFEEGLKMDKRIRLASLGSFARRMDRYVFDGKTEKIAKTIEPKFPHIFFNQANTIYKIMEKCKKAAGDNFLFYWTDGIYVKNKASVEICEKIITAAGFNWVTQKLVAISREPMAFVTHEKTMNGRIDKKPYNIGMKK